MPSDPSIITLFEFFELFSYRHLLPTSENFHIRCKGTTNEEAEGEKLLRDEVGLDILQHLTYLRPKEHWQATVATHEHYCELRVVMCPGPAWRLGRPRPRDVSRGYLGEG